MNEIHVEIVLRDRETKAEIRRLGEAAHAVTDPGEDVQSVHGWRNYVAERVALAVKATVAAELTRDAVLARAPRLSGFCPRCGEELGDEELLPDVEAESRPAHVRCLETRGPVISRDELEQAAAALLQEAGDDAKTAGDDAGGEAPEGGAAGEAEGGGEAGAAGAVHPSEEVIELGAGSEAGDTGADPGSSGEDDAGSEGAEEGGDGGGEVSRRRPGRRRSS